MPDIQSAIDHIKTAIDVDPWAADMAEEFLKRNIPQKWVYDRPGHWKCPKCHTIMGRAIQLYSYCYRCGQRCEGVTATDDNG